MSESEQAKGLNPCQPKTDSAHIYLKRNYQIIGLTELRADTHKQMDISTTLQNAFIPAIGTKLQTSDGCCECMYKCVFCLLLHHM